MRGMEKESTDLFFLKFKKSDEPFLQESNQSKPAAWQESFDKGATRSRVARVGDRVFVEPENKIKKKLRVLKHSKNSNFSIDYKQWDWITWALVGLLIFGIIRLVVMDHGILQLQTKSAILGDRSLLIDQLMNENKLLIKEIDRANQDVRYQKNLAREQLGVIGPEEYLILFAPKKSDPSN